MTSSFRAENQEIGNANYDSSEEGSVVSREGYSCRLCPHIAFEDGSEYWQHIRGHAGHPTVVLHRLTDAYIEALKQRKKRPPRCGHFARKRIRSYFAPKVKGAKKNSLKLKLKLSGSSKSHFEVVPSRVLVGPGDDVCLLNGGIADSVKTEKLLDDVEWGKTVDDARKDSVVSGKTIGEETLDEVALLCEEEEDRSKEGARNEDEKKSGRKKCEEIDLGDEGFENEDLISIEKTELDIPPTPAATPVPNTSPLPSPTPPATSPDAASPEEQEGDEDDGGEDLPDSEFPEDGEDFPSSPAMVEINGSAVADVRSPVFPSTSPAPPAGQSSSTPPSQTEDLQGEGNSEGQQVLPDTEQVECDSGRGSDSSFVWNDVGDVGDGGDMGSGGGGDEDAPLEEDPLLLPEGGEAGRSGSAGASGDARSSPGTTPVEGNAQSILRDFLTEETGTGVPTSNANLEFSLGSEFISYDRLGENAAFCDVCGERTADQAALDEHRLRAGHFRCPQPACVGTQFATPDELLAHAQSVHGNQQQQQHHHTPPPVQQQRPTPPPPQQQQQQQQYAMGQSQSPVLEQAAPVQQLVQQVQRLPVPQGPMQALNRAPPHTTALVQQLSAGMVMQQQAQYHPRPPPLHPAPAPIMQQYAQSAPPPYPGPPQVMFPPQAFGPHGQAYIPNARQPMQVQGRPYMIPSSIPQQMRQVPPPRMQGPPMQRGMTAPQLQAGVGPAKRVGQQAPPPQTKHRRMDLLIPDARHDDADCHVIAMQKRTESGPVIGSVQGSPQPSSGRAESTINLTESITLSVRGQQSQPQPTGKPRNDANTVATLLATRGITVTPAGGSGRTSNQGPVPNQPQPQQLRQVNRQGPAPAPSQPQQTQPVATLNLNSAISIIPTASARPVSKQGQQQQQSQQQGNFAVPQGRSANRPQTQAQVERPPRPPTVDLTVDNPPPPPALQPVSGRGRGRGRGSLGRHMCHICDKVFNSPEALNQHIQVHRSPGKLPFRCTLCSAQYPNQQGLMQHRQTFHKEATQTTELVVPVVDLKNPTTVGRLSSLGIRHFVPLSQLANQSGGCFGLPLLSIEGGRLPNASLSALTSNRFLSFGPLRQLPQ